MEGPWPRRFGSLNRVLPKLCRRSASQIKERQSRRNRLREQLWVSFSLLCSDRAHIFVKEVELPLAVFNPVNCDYSYMRYAASLGAGGDVCGWSEADRLPDLIFSRESSPSSSSSSSSSISTIASPTSADDELPLFSGFGRNEAQRNSYTQWCAPGNTIPFNEAYSQSFPETSFSSFDTEMDVSLQIAELQESFINPFTNQEFYEELWLTRFSLTDMPLTILKA